jgi:hypothetical protein
MKRTEGSLRQKANMLNIRFGHHVVTSWDRAGGGRSQMRTGLRLQFPANREINREFCDSGLLEAICKMQKSLCRRGFHADSLQKLTGKLFSVTGNF